MNTEDDDDFDLVPVGDAGLPAAYTPHRYAPTPADYAGLPAVPQQPAGAGYTDDYAYGQGHSARPMLFGQQLPANVSPQAVHQVINEAAGIFTNDMRQLGVNAHVADAAVRWYRQMVSAPVPHESPRHGYDLSGLTIAPQDRPHATAFLNHMRQRGADQASVRNMLWWYGELIRRLQQVQQRPQQQARHRQEFTDAELDAIDARAEGDREAGRNALRVAWGHEMPVRLGLVRRYVKNLPAAARQHLENAVLPGGRMAANDPAVLLRLYDQATGGALPAGGLQKEIEAMEQRMKSDRRAWFKDDAGQARLRRLYQQRDG